MTSRTFDSPLSIAVVGALYVRKEGTAREIANFIGFKESFQRDSVRITLQRLEEHGLVQKTDGTYRLTEKGQQKRSELVGLLHARP